MNELIIENNKILYPKYPSSEHSIILELYRGKLICSLYKKFTNMCIKLFGYNVFNTKKSYGKTINDILTSWFFSQYSYYSFNNDSVLFNINHTANENIKSILEDYTKTYMKNNKNEKINKIIEYLINEYNDLLVDFTNYKTTEFYDINKYNYNVTKKIIKLNRDSNNIEFYKFKLNLQCNIKIYNLKLSNILNNIIIPVNEYNRLLNIYNDTHNIDEIIWIILFRYQLFGSNNNQLSVLPHIVEQMKKDFSLNTECFASAINTSTRHFCSLFYDVEKYFGSIGSIFNTKIKSGTYSFNPPYQKDIITHGINKIFNYFENTTDNLNFIITIPIWDIEGKKYMKSIDSENNNDNIDYGTFPIMDIVRNSQYLKGIKMISKNDFTYMDHNYYLFKNKTIQNTYVIVLSNNDNDIYEKINNYNFYNYNFYNF